MSDNYYELLGVDKTASDAELKKAFRKKAQEYHPDKPTGDEEKFKSVNEAYSVLSDKQKRQQYDTFGKAGAQQGAGGFGGGFDFSGFQQGAGGFEFDLGDIFNQFGGFGGGGRRQRRGNDISVETTISFKESVFGVEKEFELVKDNICEECEETGAHKKKTKACHECNGNGRVSRVQRTIMGNVQTQTTCTTCAGRGQLPEENCHSCKGAGTVRSKEKVGVKIPAGIEDGQQLRMSGRGEALAGSQSGDLYIQVRVTPQKNFQKSGKDIHTIAEITMSEAALGAKKTIPTVDGEVTIKIPSGTTTGKQLRVKEEGVVITDNRRGDLYVELIISVPTKLSKQQKKLLESLQETGL